MRWNKILNDLGIPPSIRREVNKAVARRSFRRPLVIALMVANLAGVIALTAARLQWMVYQRYVFAAPWLGMGIMLAFLAPFIGALLPGLVFQRVLHPIMLRDLYAELHSRGYPVCPDCGHDRTGLDAPTPCPECGSAASYRTA